MTKEKPATTDRSELRPPAWLRVSLWMLLVAVATLSIYTTRPPAARDRQTPAQEFSAERAMALLPRIAAQPRPVGSKANEDVRRFLIERLRQLGAEVHVEKTVGVVDRGRLVRAGRLQNIVAVRHGRTHGPALMLVAHYDSVPEGPGAADDGAGLITILETLRALGQEELANDLIILFTDGEEAGLLGAAAFVTDHPDLAQTVGLVLNLEARGSSGQPLMFETSEGNGWLISEFARAAPYPVASSLMYSIYKLLPNETDFTELRRAGVAGFNFAFVEHLQNYHTSLDTPINLDPGSVQALGANVLGLVRRLGEIRLQTIRQPDCVYFNWFGHALAVYPLFLIKLLTATGFGLLLLALIFGHKTGRLRFRSITLAIHLLLTLAVGAGLVLLWTAICLLYGTHLLVGDTPSNLLLFAGLTLIGLFPALSLLDYASQRLGWRELTFGLLLVSSIIGSAVSFFLPGASYLFQWPLLFGSASLLLSLFVRGLSARISIGLLAALPILLIIGPLLYRLAVVMGSNAISLVMTSILLTLFLAVSWPLLELIKPSRRVMIVGLIIPITLFAGGIALSRPSALHPRRDNLTYSLNADQQRARWLSDDNRIDDWTRRYLGEHPRNEMDPNFRLGIFREALAADAPLVPLPAPNAQLVEDNQQAGIRSLKLHLTSARNAPTISLTLPGEIELLAVKWDGRPHEIRNTGKLQLPWRLRFEALPSQGVDLELTMRDHTPLTLWLGDLSRGLPLVTGQGHNTRPDYLIPGSGSDVTIVAKKLTF